MKKSKLFLAVAAGLLLAVATSRLLAADAPSKEVTITGTWSAANARCTRPTDARTSSRSRKDGKTVNYYLDTK